MKKIYIEGKIIANELPGLTSNKHAEGKKNMWGKEQKTDTNQHINVHTENTHT